jgi:hypothetical protein
LKTMPHSNIKYVLLFNGVVQQGFELTHLSFYIKSPQTWLSKFSLTFS